MDKDKDTPALSEPCSSESELCQRFATAARLLSKDAKGKFLSLEASNVLIAQQLHHLTHAVLKVVTVAVKPTRRPRKKTTGRVAKPEDSTHERVRKVQGGES